MHCWALMGKFLERETSEAIQGIFKTNQFLSLWSFSEYLLFLFYFSLFHFIYLFCIFIYRFILFYSSYLCIFYYYWILLFLVTFCNLLLLLPSSLSPFVSFAASSSSSSFFFQKSTTIFLTFFVWHLSLSLSLKSTISYYTCDILHVLHVTTKPYSSRNIDTC